MSTDQDMLDWIQKEYIPTELLKKGFLLKNLEMQTSGAIGTDHFTSHNYFCVMEVEDAEKKRKKEHVIIKATSQHKQFRDSMDVDGQFANEILAYEKMIPLMDTLLKPTTSKSIYELCPKLWFGCFNEDHPEKSVLVLENLKIPGFKPADSLSDLDLEHCKLVFEYTARFHAISYAWKIKDPESFKSLASTIHEIRYPESRRVYNQIFFSYPIDYFVDHLLKNRKGYVPEEYLLKIKKMWEKAHELLTYCSSPKEPLSVICHGDLCRNNMLFKYEDDVPVDMRFIDFQTIRYATPIHDLSFYIYMNTTHDLRKKHLPDLLKLYHSTLVKNVSELVKKPEEEIANIYRFELFEEEFRKYAHVGFATAVFFLPMMMSELPPPPLENFEEEFIQTILDPLESAKDCLRHLNEKSVSRIEEMFLDMYERKVD